MDMNAKLPCYYYRGQNTFHNPNPSDIRPSQTGPLICCVLFFTLQTSASHRTHHVRLPQRFAHAVHLLGAGAAHDKVLCDHGAADQIQRADEGFVRLGVQACDHRLDVVWPEPREKNMRYCVTTRALQLYR